ncbi:MAG: hypothetical protein WCP56_00675 [Candidatus Saccharibacteria bacterium]
MSLQKKSLLLAAGVAAVLLLLLVTAAGGGGKTETATDTQEVDLVVSGGACDNNGVVAFSLLALGFTPEQVAMGGDIDWAQPEANERGAAAFGDVTPTSAQELVAKLQAPDEKSVAALNALLAQSGATREALLDPNTWTAVQFRVETVLEGNSAFKNGTAIAAGTRQSASGDVAWYFVNPLTCKKAMDGEIPPQEVITIVRAGCSNIQFAPIRPAGAPAPAAAPSPGPAPTPKPPTTCDPRVCKGPATAPVAGDRGSGGSPGNGGAINPGDTGYTPEDPAPPPKVPPAAPPTSVESLPGAPGASQGETTIPITPMPGGPPPG